MKFLKIILIPILLLVVILSCHREDSLLITNDEIEIRSIPSFNDSADWEIITIFNIFQLQDSRIDSFKSVYGDPRYDLAFQKRGSQIKITSVPTFKNGALTGVFKMYHSINDTLRLNYFSIDNLNSILEEHLGTQEYQIFRGAIQSVIITQVLANLPISQTYIDWLVDNANRIEERVIWYCVEEWECIDGVYTSSTTGWSYDNNSNFNTLGTNLGNQQSRCRLISRECWVDWSERVFPSSGGGHNININWNYYLHGGGFGNSGIIPPNGSNTPTWAQEKLANAKECINNSGLIGSAIDLRIREKSLLLCGATYEDLLVRAYENMIEVGKDCNDLGATAEMLSDMESMVDSNISWAGQDLEDYVSELLEGELIDPCRTSLSSEQLIRQAVGSICDEGGSPLENFETELFDEIKIIKVDKSLNDCPLIKCGIKNALKSTQTNLCEMVELLQQSRVSYNLMLGNASAFTNSQTRAVTTINPSSGISEIRFNPLYCDDISSWSQEEQQKQRLYMSLAVMHELLHVHLDIQVVNLYLAHGKSLPISQSFEDAFNNLLLEEQYCLETMPGVHDQHVIIGEVFAYDLAVAAWEANGKIGEPSDYLCFVWQALWKEGITPEEFMDYDSYNTMWQTFYTNVGWESLNVICD
ncbi:MAG TPA: hypothetical protein VFV79_06480 [Saprospiraceae bacterium]|nr:hypothetical protein [Saprospiraceae bacterium]